MRKTRPAEQAYADRLEMIMTRLETLTSHYRTAEKNFGRRDQPVIDWGQVGDLGHAIEQLDNLMLGMGLLPDADATENERVAQIAKNGGWR